MTRHHARRRPMSDINVVPYIDVMLVLLVIFMITAPLLTEGVKVDLPQATARPLPQDDTVPLVVTVDANGAYFLNKGENIERPVDAETLVIRVAAQLQHDPATSVLVKGDRRVDYGKVINAVTLLQQAGAASVGLVTETPESFEQR